MDGMIQVNKVMHNTLWVPGHFHFYLLLGEAAMAWGFMAWLTRQDASERLTGTSYAAFLAYLLGGLGFVITFLAGGASSIPRRWAVHSPEWIGNDHISILFAALSILGAVVFLGQFLIRMRKET